ncbi:MAG: class D beta-lactamase [Flavobacteriaceae bacterium]
MKRNVLDTRKQCGIKIPQFPESRTNAKVLHVILWAFLLVSCTEKQKANVPRKEAAPPQEIITPAFQNIIDSAKVTGAILIYDPQEDKYYSNDFKWAKKGYLPASTFKITNSIIALETGIVKNDSTIFTWDGEKRAMDIWEQDLTLTKAFHFSCVPCYQEIARKIGPERMRLYLDTLDYGKMTVDASNIDVFWLEGNSRIDQYGQIAFLRRFHESQLPITDRTRNIMKRVMVLEEDGQYRLSGKTGWSIRNGNNNGWFVGYVEAKGNVYFFATNIEPKEQFNMDLFPVIRKDITHKALSHLGIVK